MHFRIMVKKSVLRALPFAILFIYMLSRISLWENSVLRVVGISIALIVFCVLLFTIIFLMFRTLMNDEESPNLHADGIDFNKSETIEIEELVAIDEENDFGELLEVEEQDFNPEEMNPQVFHNEIEMSDIKKHYSTSTEIIEELEVYEDPVEELEAVDE